jgi:ParB-like chromosome segregation protein Spo0J
MMVETSRLLREAVLPDGRVPAPRTADPDEVASSTRWVESHPVSTLRIDSLVFADSPRLAGEDADHIRLLAEAGDTVPPIIVHRPTRRVIDGVHRVRAALLNGRTEIRVRLVDCDSNAAFILAVQANVTHGLPLSQADRAAAAARIIRRHPQWSDRAVAEVTGLSGKTVSRIRQQAMAESAHPDARLGRDGRLRPLDSGPQRRQAAAMINDRPELGLREVARATGLSAATVQDVRQRIRRGEDPVPERYRLDRYRGERPGAPAERTPASLQPGGTATLQAERGPDPHSLLAQLRRDPALPDDQSGREALRWLYRHTVDATGLQHLGRGLPDHWAPVIADLARTCASAWTTLADRLEQHAN